MSLNKIHLPPKITDNTQEAVATEKLFTGTLSKNETKRNRLLYFIIIFSFFSFSPILWAKVPFHAIRFNQHDVPTFTLK